MDNTLGTVYRKLAEEGLVGDVSQALGATGPSPEQYQGGFTPAMAPQGGVGIPYYGVAAGVQGISPESAAIMQGLGPFIYPWLQKNYPQLVQPRRFGSGPGTVTEYGRQMQVMQRAAMRAMAMGGDRIGAGLEQIGEKLGGMPGMMVKNIAGLAKQNPQNAGMFVQMARAASPEINQLITAFMPDVPSSYMPIANAVYRQTGGKFDENLFNQKLNEFETAYKDGKFADHEGNAININDAMSGVLADAELHPEHTSIDNAAKLSQASSWIMANGMATTTGAAMGLVKQFGADKAISNPAEFYKTVDGYRKQLTSAGVDPNTMSQASQLSHQMGIPFNQAVSAIKDPAVLTNYLTSHGVRPDQANMYAASVGRAGTQGEANADSYKAVSAYVQVNPKGAALLKKFQQTGNPQDAAALFTAARNDPQARMLKDSYDGNMVSSWIPPNMSHSMAVGDILSTESGAYGARDLGRLAQHPEELQKRMKPDGTFDFSGYDVRTQRALGNKAIVGTLMGSLAEKYTNQRAAQTPSVAPTTTPPLPAPIDQPKPAPTVPPVTPQQPPVGGFTMSHPPVPAPYKPPR